MECVFKVDKKPIILVFGDSMVDETVTGSCSRIANEGPFPVLKQDSVTYTLGGCGNVAANLRAMGARVILCTATGNDTKIEELFACPEDMYASKNRSVQTTVKSRYFAGTKSIFKKDIIGSSLSTIGEDELQSYLRHIFVKTPIDAVVISDYNLGVCTLKLCQYILQWCRLMGIPVVVDPKVDADKYVGCTILKPNMSEAKRITGLQEGSVVDYHRAIFSKTYTPFTVITRAEEGLSLYDHIANKEYTYKVPQVEVFDVTGAGDIVCASLAYCIAIQESFENIVKAAVFLATQSVQHPGSYVLQESDFWLLRCHLHPSKRITHKELKYLPKNKKIVFTNGCFDMMHIGHIESLQDAKKQGDLLVVGINTDTSVRKLKGTSRPLFDEEIRTRCVEALECVDYVILFGDDTPSSILKELRPEVYVKGIEYSGKYLAGSEYSKKVHFVDMKTNISTTKLVRVIKGLP